jgi:hypothetical protein
MDRLSGVNYAGMASALLLAVVAVGLGASALARGVAHALPLLPPPRGLDLERLASTAAVVLTAFVGERAAPAATDGPLVPPALHAGGWLLL